MNRPFLAEPEWLGLVDVTFLPLALASRTHGVGLSLRPRREAGQSPGQARGSESAEKRGPCAGELLGDPGTTLISANGTTRISPTCLGGLSEAARRQ
ncbi:unnamed protein product [Rangifer tarandus platyrhynchus]|uniref:Uncharacterized protein n=2 Tax=Rangifer tarandus platyrhynchus TaxID=3082113 RepID=A0ACB0F6J7_RANTA|nr:unnamed protein product [Rangifer tarandus platyrhynchus]CAI9707716.1 unnamed protein product [Rangifer tarandus platyrhynchus]